MGYRVLALGLFIVGIAYGANNATGKDLFLAIVPLVNNGDVQGVDVRVFDAGNQENIHYQRQILNETVDASPQGTEAFRLVNIYASIPPEILARVGASNVSDGSHIRPVVETDDSEDSSEGMSEEEWYDYEIMHDYSGME